MHFFDGVQREKLFWREIADLVILAPQENFLATPPNNGFSKFSLKWQFGEKYEQGHECDG